MKLGRVTLVEARSVWKNEAQDFTPWLAEPDNLSLLAETLHLGRLTVQSVEHSVGDFSADIVAEDEGGVQVLIENQLEPTDHRHLGQLITYLAGLEGDAAVVWIATRFREEHRAAIDWLNAHTGEGFDFFGVEVDVIRIGDSIPAPRFKVVGMPNDWAKQARLAVRRAAANQVLSDSGTLYQSYWLSLREAYQAEGEIGRFPKPWSRHWLPFSVGRSGFQLSVVLHRAERQVRFELYMLQKGIPSKQAYRALLMQKDVIEEAYGGALDWQELPEARASRVATYLRDVDVGNNADWARQHHWIIQQIRRFRTVFTDRVRALRLDDAENEDNSNEDHTNI